MKRLQICALSEIESLKNTQNQLAQSNRSIESSLKETCSEVRKLKDHTRIAEKKYSEEMEQINIEKSLKQENIDRLKAQIKDEFRKLRCLENKIIAEEKKLDSVLESKSQLMADNESLEQKIG